MSEISQSLVKSILNYNPDTGVFVWEAQRKKIVVGSVAGGDNGHGYWVIRIDGRLYRAHQLAWLYVYGEWPDRQIDHINGNRSDNRISNLRLATQSQNNANTRVLSSMSGIKGVGMHNGRWRAQIRIDGKKVHLGYFDCPAVAHFAYQIAADNHFGEYARIA